MAVLSVKSVLSIFEIIDIFVIEESGFISEKHHSMVGAGRLGSSGRPDSGNTEGSQHSSESTSESHFADRCRGKQEKCQ